MLGRFFVAMQFLLNGKRWRLERATIRRKQNGRTILGECSSPDAKPRVIRVDKRIDGESELDVLLHELLHAAAWDVLDESFVDTTATGIARLLWRIGYRKQAPE